MRKKTKIVATIGPASHDPVTLKDLIQKGVNIFRLNTKHNSIKWHEETIEMIRAAEKAMTTPVGIMVDIPSPSHNNVIKMTKEKIKQIDFVALSYTQTKNEIIKVRKELKDVGSFAQIVAKIENQNGVDNITEIISEADGIMIARGDLGDETPIERLAYYQKKIITECRTHATPVIVATEMLLSMTQKETPTRAEATDVANAVLDGTDALMLSEETAIGKFPIEAVKTMAKIALYNEKKTAAIDLNIEPKDATVLIVEAAEYIVEHSKNVDIKRVVVFSETGYTAKILSSLRPNVEVTTLTRHQKVVEGLTLYYGVYAYLADLPANGTFNLEKITATLKKDKLVEKNDIILLIHGQHWMRPGQTNAVALITVE